MCSSTFFTLSAILFCCYAAKFPSHWTACKQGPKHNDCLRTAIQKTIPDLVKGLPHLGIIPVDPLRFPKVTIEQGTGPVSVNLDLMDLEIKGLKNVQFNEIRNDWKDMVVHATLPHLKLKSQYRMDGKVLILPVHGSGDCMIELGNVTGTAALHFYERIIEKKEHYQIKAVDVKIDDTRSLHLHFNNLFDGNKQLGDHFNVFINENWRDVFEELKPAIEKAIKQASTAIANQFFTKVPKNEITPS